MTDWFSQVKKEYTFDDVYLIPGHSKLRSRSDPDLTSEIVLGLKFNIPIISANMSSVTEHAMVNKMCELGATAALHRYMSPWGVGEQRKKISIDHKGKYGISIGLNKKYIDTVLSQNNDIGFVVIDVAHGDCSQMIETIKYVKTNFSSIKIVAGNVCTSSSVVRFIEAGASSCKIGIGPGNRCKTRTVAGVGYPQLSAIKNIHILLKDLGVTKEFKLIADGGFKTSGDIVKGLAAGADFVMTGSLLAGSTETPGNVITRSGNTKVKLFEGMASINAQLNWSGGEADDIASEGESDFVQYVGKVDRIINNLVKSIKQGFSYCGCRTIEELHEYGDDPTNWVKITNASLIEGMTSDDIII